MHTSEIKAEVLACNAAGVISYRVQTLDKKPSYRRRHCRWLWSRSCMYYSTREALAWAAEIFTITIATILRTAVSEVFTGSRVVIWTPQSILRCWAFCDWRNADKSIISKDSCGRRQGHGSRHGPIRAPYPIQKLAAILLFRLLWISVFSASNYKLFLHVKTN
jgi:hypothetical protein